MPNFADREFSIPIGDREYAVGQMRMKGYLRLQDMLRATRRPAEEKPEWGDVTGALSGDLEQLHAIAPDRVEEHLKACRTLARQLVGEQMAAWMARRAAPLDIASPEGFFALGATDSGMEEFLYQLLAPRNPGFSREDAVALAGEVGYLDGLRLMTIGFTGDDLPAEAFGPKSATGPESPPGSPTSPGSTGASPGGSAGATPTSTS